MFNFHTHLHGLQAIRCIILRCWMKLHINFQFIFIETMIDLKEIVFLVEHFNLVWFIKISYLLNIVKCFKQDEQKEKKKKEVNLNLFKVAQTVKK